MFKVRAGNTYAMPFVVNLGQRNAEIVNGHLTPLRRIIPHTVAFTIIRSDYHLIHSMNAVPLFAKVPFVISFEDWMPRTPPDIRIGVLERLLTRVLASERCMALLPMSQFARMQMMMQQHESPHYKTLLDKSEVIYPSVPATAWPAKKLGDELRLLFVGADFMRKGLPALITAHEELERRGVPVRTTVVSSLRWSSRDYVGPKAERIVEDQKRRLGLSSIHHLNHLPNATVQQLMREHDLLILPTLHDTFGYVTLEAMASGTPVIATDTCALPEIIDRRNGILLPLPTDHIGRWNWLYHKRHREYDLEYLTEMGRLSRALVDSLLTVWGDRLHYEEMSMAALMTIAEKFNRDIARDQLETLYDRAIRVFH